MIEQRVLAANKGKVTINLLMQRLKSITTFASRIVCLKTHGQQQIVSDVFPIKS